MAVLKRASPRVARWVWAARELLVTQRAGAGWGYRASGAACVEPTVLASLALLGQVRDPSDAATLRYAESSSAWLLQLQENSGAVPNSGDQAGRWATPYAILLWHAVGGYAQARTRAIDWLLARKGRTFPRDASGPIGHDTSLVGWPWIEDTHSWLEPTALAVAALCREGLSSHKRTREGVRVILDRAIGSGGWNYGNNVVFGRELRPRPAPTGIALMALAASGSDGAAIDRASRYLEQALPEIRSAQSLCWGLLGLEAWGRRPDGADGWLAEAFGRARRRSESPCQISYLLLAAARDPLAAFGIDGKGRL